MEDRAQGAVPQEEEDGALESAPLIANVPFAAGCRLLHTLPLGVDTLYVSEIVAVHADEEALDRGEVDRGKVRPILFTLPRPSCWRLGAFAGRAWSIGKGFRKA